MSGFNEKYFLSRFSKNTQIPDFMIIRQLEAEVFHADRGTDIMKLIVALRNFENKPKILRPNN
jgi:hypothetical protein